MRKKFNSDFVSYLQQKSHKNGIFHIRSARGRTHTTVNLLERNSLIPDKMKIKQMNNFKKRDEDETEHELQEWFSGAHRVVVAGIGNSLRRDDFVGVRIVKDLQDSVSSSVYLIECETVPESFIEPIIRFNPSHILIIDAALLDSEPGSAKLLSSKQLTERQAVSTHALPLRIFCDYLAKTTSAKIALLLIQPGNTSFGEGLTREVQNTADHIARLLTRFLRV